MKNAPRDIINLHMCTKSDNDMMYGFWDMERDSQIFLSFWTVFFLFLPLTTQKVKISKNWKKNLELLSFYTFCAITGNHKIYGSWDIERNRDNFLSFWTIFGTFTRITIWKTKILKKNKKTKTTTTTTENIIILCLCTTNGNHMVYGSWDTESNRQNLLSFWTSFFPFTHLATQKSKILKKWKKRLEILSFYTCVPQWKLYDVWFLRSWYYAEIWSTKDNLFVILGYFLPFYPIKNPKNQTFENLENHFTCM